MKITPVASPHQVQQPTSTTNYAKAAVEAFNRTAAAQAGATDGNSQQTPVSNPNQVSAEDLSAIKPSSRQMSEINELPKTEVTEETHETPKEVKPEQDPALKRQFEQLARQERINRQKVQQQQNELKAKEAQLAAREAALAAKDSEYGTKYVSKDRIKQDALTVLADAGISYEDLTNQLLSQVPTDPRVNAHISRLEAKIQELEAKGQAFETNSKQAQADSYQAAVKQIGRDVQALVKEDPVSFEAVAKTPGAIKEVVKLIEQVYAKDGVLLSVEEAAQEIENELVDRGLKTYNQIEKIKKRLAESSTKTEQNQTAQTKQSQSPMKTLTNAAASTRQLSNKERAMLAFKGELK
jgi:hypothetical protein